MIQVGLPSTRQASRDRRRKSNTNTNSAIHLSCANQSVSSVASPRGTTRAQIVAKVAFAMGQVARSFSSRAKLHRSTRSSSLRSSTNWFACGRVNLVTGTGPVVGEAMPRTKNRHDFVHWLDTCGSSRHSVAADTVKKFTSNLAASQQTLFAKISTPKLSPRPLSAA